MKKKSKGRIEKFNRNAQVVDFKRAQKQKAKEEKAARKARKAAQKKAAAQAPRSREDQKRKKRFDRQRHRRHLLVAVVVVILLAITGASAYGIVRMKVEQDRLLAQQEELQKEKDKLKKELQTINDPDYIEQQARRQLNLIMPGETLYLLPDKEKKESGDD